MEEENVQAYGPRITVMSELAKFDDPQIGSHRDPESECITYGDLQLAILRIVLWIT